MLFNRFLTIILINMFNYDLVIFDLDGTLLNSEEGVFESIKYAVKQVGVKTPSTSLLKMCIGPPLNVSFPKLGIPSDKMEEAVKAMKESYEIKECYKKAELYPDTIQLLKLLKSKNIKLAVATLKPYSVAVKVLEYFSILQYFDCVIGPSGDDAVKSTKATYISRCLKKLDVEPSKTLMVGDYDSDAIGSYENGCDFAAAMFGFGFNKENIVNFPSKYLLNSYLQLINIIKS